MSNPTFTVQFAEEEIKKYLSDLNATVQIGESLEDKIADAAEAVTIRILDHEFDERLSNALNGGWTDPSDYFNMEEYLTKDDLDNAVEEAYDSFGRSNLVREMIDENETIKNLQNEIKTLNLMVRDINATLLRMRVAFLGEEPPKKEEEATSWVWSTPPLAI